MKRNTRIRRHALWLTFTGVVLIALLLAGAFILLTVVLLYRFGGIGRFWLGTPFPTTLLYLSAVISTAVTFAARKYILKPLSAFSESAKEIAKGNFHIRFREDFRTVELAEMGKSFNFMASELDSIETLRNDFVLSVSHEFKTPLAAIEGYAMLLQDQDLSPDERSEYAGMIIESARQLSALSGNILRLSKLDQLEALTEKTCFRLDEQLRQAVLLLERQWSDKDLNLSLELDRADYTGDETLLMQVWMNLIGNAIKFTPAGGEIGLTLTKREDSLCVTVTDNGAGMSPDVQRRIFDKFYQGDHARSGQGNGLGLALAKRVTELSGGSISVESAPGKGSRFTVTLPAVE